MRNESGFTLIEIVVSIVLVGMMAAIAGMGIVTGTKGYLLAKENSHMAQKAQLAMARIQRELMELTDIAVRQADPAFIIYDNTTGRHAIARDDTTIKMFDLALTATVLPSMDQGDILVDNVNNFALDYFQGANIWGGVNIQLLSAIQADLSLDRSDGAGNTVTFTTTVNPRNTNNYGGVPPTTTPYTAHNYACFVATTAEGNFDPPTMLLFSLSIVTVMLFFLLSLNYKAGKLEGFEAWKQKNLSASWPPSLPASLLRQNKGNVLIGLIVTMMIFAALGAGMVAMTGTSTSSQVTANTTSKAYYLAESGFRYAASEYLDEGDTDTDGEIEDDRNLVLVNLDGSTFTFVNPDERFSLEVFPYYFVTSSSHNIGDTALNTNFPGNIPDDFSMPTTGRLSIGSGIYNYTDFSGGIFTLATGLLEAISDNMNVNSVGNPSANATMTNGGDLTLSSASFFPAITGKFMIDGIAYTYKTKNEDTLQNITDANDPDRGFSLSVVTSTNLILKPYLKVHSTGIVGQGAQAASREIVYNVPIPDSLTEGTRVEFHDTFEDKSHWKDPSILGSHGVQTIGGDSALKVIGTQTSGGVEASLIGLDWASTNANLASAHSLSGYFLSYDAQVKVGFDPAVLPDDYAAGLSFRLDQVNNSYGVSFMEADNDSPTAIDPNIIPPGNYNIPMIVLWQQTGLGLTRNWLAYTFGVEEPLDDIAGWIGVPPWSTFVPGYNSPTCWMNDLSGAPPAPPITEESLITPAIDLSDPPSAVLTFWHKYDTSAAGDMLRVFIDGTEILSFPTPLAQNWTKVTRNITDYRSNSVQIEFRITTSGGSAACEWYIDDVTIHRGFPVNDSTLLVRIKEGATVEFDNGGPTVVEDGDTLTQASGAQGVVVGEPIIDDSGDWATSNARGIIILNKLSGPVFLSGQTLTVTGKGAVADCTGYNSRDNFIKVFYGYDVGNGANPDPFDDLKKDNMRNEPHLHWPPDDLVEGLWPPGPMGDPNAHDYFTLVKWHEVVDSLVVPSVEVVPSKYEPGVIIRSDESVLLTPDSGTLSYVRPELGLHTFGTGSTNVYFDDFGLLVEIAAGSGFLTPIQE